MTLLPTGRQSKSHRIVIELNRSTTEIYTLKQKRHLTNITTADTKIRLPRSLNYRRAPHCVFTATE